MSGRIDNPPCMNHKICDRCGKYKVVIEHPELGKSHFPACLKSQVPMLCPGCQRQMYSRVVS